MKIKRFKLKDNIQFQDLRQHPGINPGGSYIQKDAVLIDSKFAIHKSIDVEIGFPEDLTEWNDIDYVLVLDFDFGQPFYPFYRFLATGENESRFVSELVERYNNWMSSRDYLEEINN